MNKQGLIEVVHQQTGGTKTEAQEIVEGIVDSIVDSLKNGEEVSISGLGTFTVKHRNARQARNPRTGETVDVPAMNVPKFKPAKGLKDAVK